MTDVDVSVDGAMKMLKTVGGLSKRLAKAQVQAMIVPKVMVIFTEFDHEDLRRIIKTDYDLVRKETPEGYRNALYNLGSNPDMREQWRAIVLSTVTPENVIDWLRNPEEWLDAAEADEQREELRRCADVIEETDGGMEWLNRQVYEVYRLARLTEDTAPGETPKRVGADD